MFDIIAIILFILILVILFRPSTDNFIDDTQWLSHKIDNTRWKTISHKKFLLIEVPGTYNRTISFNIYDISHTPSDFVGNINYTAIGQFHGINPETNEKIRLRSDGLLELEIDNKKYFAVKSS
jgi:hypothetical protein